jgi:hypothetical protein
VLQWLRRTAVGESEGAVVGIQVGASVGVTMGVLVGSGATSAKSAGGLQFQSDRDRLCCPTAYLAYARSARGGDRIDVAQVSAGYRVRAGCMSSGGERRALGQNGSWRSAGWARKGGASAR